MLENVCAVAYEGDLAFRQMQAQGRDQVCLSDAGKNEAKPQFHHSEDLNSFYDLPNNVPVLSCRDYKSNNK